MRRPGVGKVGGFAVVVALVLGAAPAPASVAGGGSTGSTRSTGPSAPVRGVTATTVKVAGIMNAGLFGDAAVGAQVRFDAANREGGVAGRTIVYGTAADDKGNADTDFTEAKRLVETEQVFAIVPAATTVLSGPYLVQQHVPVAGWGIAPAFCGAAQAVIAIAGCAALGFPTPYASNAWVRAVGKLLRAQGEGSAKGKTAAVVTETGAAGELALRVVPAGARSAGMQVVYEKAALAEPPQVVADFGPAVADVMKANNGAAPDVVFVEASVSNTVGLQRALLVAGFRGILTNTRGYAPALAAPQAGASVFTPFATPEAAASSPEMAKIVTALTPALAGRAITPAAIAGYLSADLFLTVLRAVGKQLTPATFAKAAKRITYKVAGVVGPTRYPAGGRVATPCGQILHSDATRWTVLVPYTCYDVLDIRGSKPKTLPYKKV